MLIPGLILQTTESTLKPGVHDINKPLELRKQPGLLIHDSRGIEAGSDQALQAMGKFVRQRAKAKEPKERLHAIWSVSYAPLTSTRAAYALLGSASTRIPVVLRRLTSESLRPLANTAPMCLSSLSGLKRMKLKKSTAHHQKRSSSMPEILPSWQKSRLTAKRKRKSSWMR